MLKNITPIKPAGMQPGKMFAAFIRSINLKQPNILLQNTVPGNIYNLQLYSIVSTNYKETIFKNTVSGMLHTESTYALKSLIALGYYKIIQ